MTGDPVRIPLWRNDSCKSFGVSSPSAFGQIPLWRNDPDVKKAPVRLNLQLFAGEERTEKATPKKRQDTRKKGQVFQSREIVSAMVLMLVFAGLRVFGGYIYSEVALFTRKILVDYTKSEGFFTINAVSKLFWETLLVLFKTTAPLMGIALIAGLAASYAQVGFLFTMETLGFKFERINPFKGIKRIFSVRALVELLKSIIKITIVGYIGYAYLRGEASNMLSIMGMDVMNIGTYIGLTSINIAIRMCIALILLGVLDFGYQWWQHEKDLRMTKQEIKEEYKQTEGNPEIKGKIKQKQRQLSLRRMLHDVPKADVVITNPTHYAIAVKYDSKTAAAPVVLAKGQDYMAQRIKDVAKDNKIEIVENKPLARSLYDTVEIGQEVPPELYQAVAEVLAFVYNLKGMEPAMR